VAPPAANVAICSTAKHQVIVMAMCAATSTTHAWLQLAMTMSSMEMKVMWIVEE
jgi:hypothetical protein